MPYWIYYFDQDMQFGRKLKLRSDFGPNNNVNDIESMFHEHNKNLRTEPGTLDNLYNLERFSNSLKEHNLTKEESKALQILLNRNYIIVCNADKERSLVIINVNDEDMRQSIDTNHYKDLPRGPTTLHCN